MWGGNFRSTYDTKEKKNQVTAEHADRVWIIAKIYCIIFFLDKT